MGCANRDRDSLPGTFFGTGLKENLIVLLAVTTTDKDVLLTSEIPPSRL